TERKRARSSPGRRHRPNNTHNNILKGINLNIINTIKTKEQCYCFNTMIYRLESHQIIGISPEKAWEFLSKPENLAKITPTEMSFEMTYRSGSTTTYAGQIIGYNVRPLLGISMSWITEITHVVPGSYFVDEQRFGPYAFWHHQHWIHPHPSGTEMRDVVNYKLPWFAMAPLSHKWLIRPKLESIFNYRTQMLNQLFPVTS
ncbi:MAG: SRPBCC family protein, partial [Bacteroidia bacterium]